MIIRMLMTTNHIGRYLIAAAAVFVLLDRAMASDAHWTALSATALIQFANDIDRHGLDRSRYPIADLEEAVERADAVAIELAATDLFGQLAHDLSQGATPENHRRAWRIENAGVGEAAIREALDAGLRSGRPEVSLEGLAPPQAAYGALMAALAAAPDDEEKYKETLRINMERWRWMPRDLGAGYLLVNIPAFEAIFVRGGDELARYRVIAGAKKTPTPQFSALATGVTVNPTWFVPSSIVTESVGALLKNKPEEAARLGYYIAEDGGVRQKPGPANALGRLKLAMPNPYSIFIHDTPNRKIFDKENRALSHGCIRVSDAEDFAAQVLGEPWDGEMIDRLIDAGATATIELDMPIPVYVAYFTAMPHGSGEVAVYPDVYGLDRAMMKAEAAPARSTADAVIAGNCPPEARG